MGLGYNPDATVRRETPRIVPVLEHPFYLGLSLVSDLYRSRQLSCESADSIPQIIERPQGFPAPEEVLARNLPYNGYLGAYSPEEGRITLYAPSVDDAAARTELASRHIGSVTLIHLSVLALMHIGEDLDGRIWEGFSLGDPSPWTGGVPGPTLVLAQLFVRRFLERLADENLLNAFEVLSEKQPPAYRSWKKTAHVSLEAARAWLSAMRRGTGGSAPIDLDDILGTDRA
jgi:hypothetical protein